MRVTEITVRVGSTDQRPKELKRGKGKTNLKPAYQETVLIQERVEDPRNRLLALASEGLEELKLDRERILSEIRANPSL